MNYIPLRTELTPMNSSCTLGNLKELPAFGRAIPLRIHTENMPSRVFGVLTKNIIMNDLTNQKTALRSLFKHLTDGGFSIKSVEPQHVEDDDDIFLVTKITAYGEIIEHYFVYDDDYILTVEKDGKYAHILQTWWGGVEGLYSNASCDKEIFDDLEKVSEEWYDEMQAKDIQF
jgi:hypothetical protein